MTDEVEQTEDEELLFFRRFPKEKQDQVRALVNYATLMGLNGKDLVSIGGKLDRIKVRREIVSNRAIVESMDIRAVGNDGDCRRRWNYYHNGVRYTFTDPGWYDVRIKNNTTGAFKTVRLPTHYDVGRLRIHGSRDLGSIMLNIYYGGAQLP